MFYPIGHWNDLQYVKSHTGFGDMCSTTMFQNHREFFRVNNIITCGVWVGQKKPNMSVLLKPILEHLDRLSITGFSFLSPDGFETIRIKLLFGVFDLVAKASVLNFKQFNGAYGCPTCLHPGEYLNTQVYPPGQTNFSIRTCKGVAEAIEEGIATRTVVEGVKGPSVLRGYLDIIKGVPADYMHCVLEGVVGSLLKMWTDSRFHSQPYSIRRHLTEIDSVFVKQRPPLEFSRPPRSIKSHLAFWKASEFRNWILFYSLPLLVHYLPPLYFHHYALLVCALHLLLQRKITPVMCNAAEEMLLDFYMLFPELYGASKCTMNVHSLKHLPYFVRLWGPLWTHSAFSFESMNGALTSMVHSTRKVAEQLSFSLDIKHSLQELEAILAEKESGDISNYIGCDSSRRSNMTMLTNGYAIGRMRSVELSSSDLQLVRKLCPQVCKNVSVFEKVYFEGMVLHSMKYLNGQGKRDNSVCFFKSVDGRMMVGRVEKFVEVAPLGTVVFLAVFNTVKRSILKMSGASCRPILDKYADVSLVSKFIIEVQPSTSMICVPLENVIAKCVLVARKDKVTFVVKFPNTHESQ